MTATALGQAAQVTDLLAPIQAQIQTDVGAFLMAKAWLLSAQRGAAVTPDQQVTIAQLLSDQAELEGELSGALSPIQAGEYTWGSVTGATSFLARMELHLQAVHALQARMPGAGPVSATTVGLDYPLLAMVGGAALGVIGLVGRSKLAMLAGGGVLAVGFWRYTAARPAVIVPAAA